MTQCVLAGVTKKSNRDPFQMAVCKSQKWALGPRLSHLATCGSLMATRSKLQGEEVTATLKDPALLAERVQTLLRPLEQKERLRPMLLVSLLAEGLRLVS